MNYMRGIQDIRNLKTHSDLIKNRLDLIDYRINKTEVGLHNSWNSQLFSPENHFSSLKSTLDFEMQEGN